MVLWARRNAALAVRLDVSGRIDREQLLLQPTRARIYQELGPSPLNASSLARALNQTSSSITWHLRKLEAAGLVERLKDANAPLFKRVSGGDAVMAEAIRVLHSVPARELMLHVMRNPGQHLGQAAAAMGAPRSRYWRSIGQLERARLILTRTRGRARLLFPAPLAAAALRAAKRRDWLELKARRTRRHPEKRPAGS